MVKFLSGNDAELIFNYLDDNCSALLSAVTEFYPDCYLENGVFAMQYEENTPASLICHGGSFSLVFTSEKSDFNELLFTAGGKIHSPNILLLPKTGEYFLLKKSVVPVQNSIPENNCKYEDFRTVLGLNESVETVNLQCLFKKGCAVPFVFAENGENAGVGMIVNSDEYAVISHVFVKEEFRRNGVGTQLVKNLLKRSESENVYLLSEKNNLEFYGRLGFTPVLTVYKYNSEKGK